MKRLPDKPEKKDQTLSERVIMLIEEARRKVASVANIALVYTYYEIGRMIVEDEQGGNIRAGYGEKILEDLSSKLTERFGKGWSKENLKLMRRFFVEYSNSVNTVYPIQRAEITAEGLVGATMYGDRHHPDRLRQKGILSRERAAKNGKWIIRH